MSSFLKMKGSETCFVKLKYAQQQRALSKDIHAFSDPVHGSFIETRQNTPSSTGGG